MALVSVNLVALAAEEKFAGHELASQWQTSFDVWRLSLSPTISQAAHFSDCSDRHYQ